MQFELRSRGGSARPNVAMVRAFDKRVLTIIHTVLIMADRQRTWYAPRENP